MEFERQTTGIDGDLAQQIIRVRFESHNAQWLQAADQPDPTPARRRNRDSSSSAGPRSVDKEASTASRTKGRTYHFQDQDDEAEEVPSEKQPPVAADPPVRRTHAVRRGSTGRSRVDPAKAIAALESKDED